MSNVWLKNKAVVWALIVVFLCTSVFNTGIAYADTNADPGHTPATVSATNPDGEENGEYSEPVIKDVILQENDQQVPKDNKVLHFNFIAENFESVDYAYMYVQSREDGSGYGIEAIEVNPTGNNPNEYEAVFELESWTSGAWRVTNFSVNDYYYDCYDWDAEDYYFNFDIEIDYLDDIVINHIGFADDFDGTVELTDENIEETLNLDLDVNVEESSDYDRIYLHFKNIETNHKFSKELYRDYENGTFETAFTVSFADELQEGQYELDKILTDSGQVKNNSENNVTFEYIRNVSDNEAPVATDIYFTLDGEKCETYGFGVGEEQSLVAYVAANDGDGAGVDRAEIQFGYVDEDGYVNASGMSYYDLTYDKETELLSGTVSPWIGLEWFVNEIIIYDKFGNKQTLTEINGVPLNTLFFYNGTDVESPDVRYDICFDYPGIYEEYTVTTKRLTSISEMNIDFPEPLDVIGAEFVGWKFGDDNAQLVTSEDQVFAVDGWNMNCRPVYDKRIAIVSYNYYNADGEWTESENDIYIGVEDGTTYKDVKQLIADNNYLDMVEHDPERVFTGWEFEYEGDSELDAVFNYVYVKAAYEDNSESTNPDGEESTDPDGDEYVAIEKIEFKPRTVIENTYGKYPYNWETDSYENWFKYYLENYDFTVYFADGGVREYTSEDVSEEWYESEEGGKYIYYNENEYFIEFSADQSRDNQWGIGTHEVTAYVESEDYTTSYTLEIIESPIEKIEFEDKWAYENTCGYLGWVYDDETENFLERYYYLYSDTNYTVTMKNGDIVKSDDSDNDESGFYYDGLYYSINYNDSQEQDAWGAGVHTVSATVCGQEYDFNYEIKECPIESVEFAEVSLVEESSEAGRWTKREGSPWRFEYLDGYGFEIFQDFTVTMKDGTVLESIKPDLSDEDIAEGEEFVPGVYYNDIFIGLVDVKTDQSDEVIWGVGEHEADVTIAGYTAKAKLNVIESPIEKIEVADKTVKKNKGGYYTTDFDEDTYESVRYYVYDTERTDFTVTMKDGTVIDFEDVWEDADTFIYDGVSYYINWDDDQSYKNPWGVGDHKVTVQFGGCKAEYTFTITGAATDPDGDEATDPDGEKHEHSAAGGWVYDDIEHWLVCECGEAFNIEDHQYSITAVEPTCTEPGYMVYTCECGDSYTAEYTPALGHEETIIPGQDPTCTQDGWEGGVECARCDEILVEPNYIPMIQCEYGDWEIVQEPTCVEDGIQIQRCHMCGNEISETIPAPGEHDWSDWTLVGENEDPGILDYERTCKRCSETEYKTEADPNYGGDYIYNEPQNVKIKYYVGSKERFKEVILGEMYEIAIPNTYVREKGAVLQWTDLDGSEKETEFVWSDESNAAVTFTALDGTSYRLKIYATTASSNTGCKININGEELDRDYAADTDQAMSDQGATVIVPYGKTDGLFVKVSPMDSAATVEPDMEYVDVDGGNSYYKMALTPDEDGVLYAEFTVIAANGKEQTYRVYVTEESGDNIKFSMGAEFWDGETYNHDLEGNPYKVQVYSSIDLSKAATESGATVRVPYFYKDEIGFTLSGVADEALLSGISLNDTYYLNEDGTLTLEFTATSPNKKNSQDYKIKFVKDTNGSGCGIEDLNFSWNWTDYESGYSKSDSVKVNKELALSETGLNVYIAVPDVNKMYVTAMLNATSNNYSKFEIVQDALGVTSGKFSFGDGIIQTLSTNENQTWILAVTSPDGKTKETYKINMIIVPDTECIEHIFGGWIIGKEATCHDNGQMYRQCDVCGEKETEIIPELEHDMRQFETLQPTCTEYGIPGHWYCAACNGKYCDEDAEFSIAEVGTIEPLGHDYIYHEAKAATCTENGWEAYETCSRCDYTTYEEIPVIDHSYGEWTYVDSSNGYLNYERKCTVCGLSEYKSEPAEEYTYNVYFDTYVEYKEFEVTTSSMTSFDEMGIDIPEPIVPISADFVGWEMYDGTIIKSNDQKFAVDGFGLTFKPVYDKQVVLLNLNYCNFDDEWIEINLCFGIEEGLTYGEFIDRVEGSGFVDFEHYSEKVFKGWNYAVSDEAAVITDHFTSIYVSAEYHEHDFCFEKYDDTEHWSECECGEKYDVEEHQYYKTDNSYPTCTEPGEVIFWCENCDYNYVEKTEPLDHAIGDGWGYNDVEHWKSCEYCGEHFRTAEHDWSDWEVVEEATCASTGVQVHRCTACGNEEYAAIPALEHDITDEWVYDSGEHWQVCQACLECLNTEEHQLAVSEDYEAGIRYFTCEICEYYYEEDIEGGGGEVEDPDAIGLRYMSVTNLWDGETYNEEFDEGLVEERLDISIDLEEASTEDGTIVTLPYFYNTENALWIQYGLDSGTLTGISSQEDYYLNEDGELTLEFTAISANGENKQDYKVHFVKDMVGAGTAVSSLQSYWWWYDYETEEMKSLTTDIDIESAKSDEGADVYVPIGMLDGAYEMRISAKSDNYSRFEKIAEYDSGYPVGSTVYQFGRMSQDFYLNEDGRTWEFSVTSPDKQTRETYRFNIIPVENPESEDKECVTHEFGDWIVVKEATCTEAGVKNHACTICGHEETAVIPVKEHSIVKGETWAPSCENPGAQEYKCENCDYTYSESIHAPGHTFGDWIVSEEATCYRDGEIYRQCANCGSAEINPIPALNHDLIQHDGKEVTCIEDGWEAYETCSRCDYTTYEVIPATDHPNRETVKGKPATCTETGLTDTELCLNCNLILEPQQVIKALGHDTIQHEGKEATCKEAGWEAYETCSRCDYTTYKEIPVNEEHSFYNWITASEPTCDADGRDIRMCSVCELIEERITTATGHQASDIWVYDDSEHWQICGNCLESLNTAEHKMVVSEEILPTCTEPGMKLFACETCEYTYEEEVPAIGHNTSKEWVYDDNEHWHVCSNCQDCLDIAVHKMTVVKDTAANCTEPGEKVFACETCEYTYTEEIPATGHTYGDWIADTEATCEAAGSQHKECACGDTVTEEITALNHDLTQHEGKAATCKETGWEAYETCSRCDYTTYKEIPATGHPYGDWEVTKETTCTEEGVETRTCACGDTETRVIEKIAHSYKAEVTAPTCTEDGYTTYTCECGDSYVADETPALGHDYESTVKEVTCFDDGFTTHVCRACGDTYSDEFISSPGHSFSDWMVEQEATCMNEGLESRSCAMCGEREESTITLASHTEGLAPTCTTAQNCTVCGEELAPAQGHTPGPDATCTTAQTCVTCGAVLNKATGHTYKAVVTAPTCTAEGYTTYTCACGDKYVADKVAAKGHKWDAGKVTTAAKCEKAGVMTYTCLSNSKHTRTETIAATGHSYGDWVPVKGASCEKGGTKKKTCENCGDVVNGTLPKTGHKEVKVAAVKATCSSTGMTAGTKCKNCDKVFSGLKVVEKKAHTLVTVKGIKATCTDKGLTDGKKCSVCGEITQKQTVIPAKGHRKTGYTSENIVEPELQADGTYKPGSQVKVYNCADCGIELSRETVKITKESIKVEVPELKAPVRVEVKTEVTSVPAAIKETAHEVKEELKDAALNEGTASRQEEKVDVVFMDIELKAQEETGTWDKVEDKDFPDAGVTITLPYPEGVDNPESYEFVIAHMITSNDRTDGKKAGDIEYLTPVKTANGLQVTVKSLSPFAVVYHEHTMKDTVKPAAIGKKGTVTTACDVCGEVKGTTAIAAVKKPVIVTKVYTGKNLTQTVKIKDTNGKVITTVKLTGKNVGTHTKTVKLSGKYSGSVKVSFQINPQGTKITKLTKNGKKQFTVKWNKKNAQVTGYQIRYGTKQNLNLKGSKTVTIAKKATTKRTIKQLKAKKKYWVQIRTYKTVNGKKYFSAWSAKKVITTK